VALLPVSSHAMARVRWGWVVRNAREDCEGLGECLGTVERVCRVGHRPCWGVLRRGQQGLGLVGSHYTPQSSSPVHRLLPNFPIRI
jgi:hypothetical protein